MDIHVPLLMGDFLVLKGSASLLIVPICANSAFS